MNSPNSFATKTKCKTKKWYADNQPSSFVKLEVAPQAGYAHIELVLRDGKRILFHHLVSSDYLKAIIS
jgi:hypothetical protein